MTLEKKSHVLLLQDASLAILSFDSYFTPDPTAKWETRHWVSVSVLEMTHHKPHSVGIQLPLGDPSACPHAKATMFPTHPAYRIVAAPPKSSCFPPQNPAL